MATPRETAINVADKIENEWGAWRRYSARHPLTATCIMFGIGAGIGYVAGLFRGWPLI